MRDRVCLRHGLITVIYQLAECLHSDHCSTAQLVQHLLGELYKEHCIRFDAKGK